MRLERFVGPYAAGVGLAMLGLWSVILVSGDVPELRTAPVELGVHLAAEGLTAAALFVFGVGAWRGSRRARRGLPVALGMLLYTVVNSAGYYAQLGETAMVAMFAVLTLATLGFVADHLGTSPAPTAADPGRGDGFRA